jgi:exodeoxyribonuclease VII small subunit
MMAEEKLTYDATKSRLEEIVASARRKDITLEQSIELLEEGVRLANLCTEHIDQTGLVPVPEELLADAAGQGEGETGSGEAASAEADEAQAADEAEADAGVDVADTEAEDADADAEAGTETDLADEGDDATDEPADA